MRSLDHVAIIMDGNGRWARRRGLPRSAGHDASVRAELRAVDAALEHGVRFLSLFAFSTENWRRPEAEIRHIIDARRRASSTTRPILEQRGVRFRRIGSDAGLPADLLLAFRQLEVCTEKNATLDLLLYFNYGGRQELVDASRDGSLRTHLYAPDAGDVDLLIRTSGEKRLSNFLLWQIAFAELFFTPVLWPDFDGVAFSEALERFHLGPKSGESDYAPWARDE